MMKKIVPDPPLQRTSTRPFGRCDAGHDPLFTVNPNISAEDALVHVALYLRSAYETGSKALDYMREEGRGMFWSNLHAIDRGDTRWHRVDIPTDKPNTTGIAPSSTPTQIPVGAAVRRSGSPAKNTTRCMAPASPVFAGESDRRTAAPTMYALRLRSLLHDHPRSTGLRTAWHPTNLP